MIHEKEIEIRWKDLDVYGHVNNAVYLTYLEEGARRVARHRARRSRTRSGATCSRAWRSTTSASSTWPTTGCWRAAGSARIGTSSVHTDRGGRHAATARSPARAEAVLVARDRESGRSRPLTERERAAFERAQVSP